MITSTLGRVELPRVIVWSGRIVGIDAIHVRRLEPHDRRRVGGRAGAGLTIVLPPGYLALPLLLGAVDHLTP